MRDDERVKTAVKRKVLCKRVIDQYGDKLGEAPIINPAFGHQFKAT